MNSAVDSAQTGLQPAEAQAGAGPVPKDVTVRYALESGPNHSSWIVDCGQNTADQLELTPGTYTLIQLAGDNNGRLKAAERLCALPTHQHMLTVQAVTGGSTEQIWCEAAQAGTLADYCAARGKLPPEQVSLIARAVTRTLSHLHSLELAYSQFTASQVAFTVDGELKLLPPDLDTRTESQARQAKFRAEDTAACASLLWLCLTGETAAPQRFRAPLHLSVPDATEALAKTLEDAIDSRSQQPTLTEIAALFEISRDPQPLDLHLSAHESVLPLLPAIRPTRPPEPTRPTLLGRKPKVLGRVPDLSAHRVAGKKGRMLWPGSGFGTGKQNARKKPLTLGLGMLVLLVGAGLGLLVLPDGANQGDPEAGIPVGQVEQNELPVVPAQSEEEAGQLPGKDQSQQVPALAQEKVSVGEGAQQASADLTDAELAQELAVLIDQRSRALAHQDLNAVAGYAVAGSDLATADTAMLNQPAAGSLAGTSTSLKRVEAIERSKDETYTALLTVTASGYRPEGKGSELASQGIEVSADGSVTQRVQLTAQMTDRGLRLISAHPAAATSP